MKNHINWNHLKYIRLNISCHTPFRISAIERKCTDTTTGAYNAFKENLIRKRARIEKYKSTKYIQINRAWTAMKLNKILQTVYISQISDSFACFFFYYFNNAGFCFLILVITNSEIRTLMILVGMVRSLVIHNIYRWLYAKKTNFLWFLLNKWSSELAPIDVPLIVI